MNGSSYRDGSPNPPFVYPPGWIKDDPVTPPDTMVVTGALCWWNETPTDLTRCIRGLANIVDRVVALDGAYRRYPGATVHSDHAQAKAIRQACEHYGMGCLILEPDRLWVGQIEKRNHLLALAAVGSDWIVTVDADHVIETERAAVRAELRASTADIVDVPFHTPKNRTRSMRDSAPGRWHIDQTKRPEMIPQIWRASLGLRIEQRHWWISAQKKGQKVWAWGGPSHEPKLPHAAFVTPYRTEHRVLHRTTEQVKASRAFCNDRAVVVAKTGQEDDVPGLPAPQFDYVTVPA